VDRRQRLSRSRDFDAVYRKGRSTSTRTLTLHWFARDAEADGEPRVGLVIRKAVGGAVERNRLKRQLREAWRSLDEAHAAGHDYVVVARPGLAEAADARGTDWLRGQLAEILEKMTT
jgi:ribonuclease P protein component